ncbi:sulfotransferase family 2 domain-containing protein [Rhodoligotrophos defluvii]|uniref:sulfotransferase family 2 domain-containing protein n=1 Tax=Rhodoligotrophos defluvii TaxID=2561934 RepID=UPI001484EFD1|nr:sulfotransferase family 2 domain-containing protein [Rhodoligotrophos defluvii]
MILSHKHRFIFLKTRKTASTSTELVLFPHCGEDDIITPLTPTDLTRKVGHRARNHLRKIFFLDPRPAIHRIHALEGWKWIDFHDHIKAADIRDYVGEKVWRSYYKFAFDRNVYDRQVSWYHYRTKSPKSARRWPDFETFLARSPRARVDNYEIYTIGGKLAVDFIGHYENLDEDLRTVMRAIGLPAPGELPFAKRGVRPESSRAYRSYYTERTRAWVESWYQGELALFGHEF